MASQPTLVVFAGVNGAGKSTFYQSGLWCECDIDSRMSRINPDEMIVAAGKDWSSPTDQLWAGKQAVGRVRDNFAHMRSFNQETTLAGKSAVARIRKAYSLGYRVRLFYIGVDSPEVALARIRHRVQVGGHDIRPEDVERRFSASISALGEVLSYTHEAVVLDNTDGFVHLAAWKNGTLCWWSPEKAKAHSWFARAIQCENWRGEPSVEVEPVKCS